MAWIVRSERAAPTDQLGGKAAALVRLSTAGFPVPACLVVTPEAFDASVTATQRDAVANASDRGAVDRVLDDVFLEKRVEDELERALRELAEEGSAFAVRSSAVDEDSDAHSFAGQLESYLFVPIEDVPRRIVDVWRSAFSERVLTYRRERNLLGLPQAPAVLVQQMVNADASGVAFSADPVSGDRNTVVVGSVYGLGTALVSGEVEGDTHHVDRDNRIVRQQIAS